jgi:hypothetical protein
MRFAGHGANFLSNPASLATNRSSSSAVRMGKLSDTNANPPIRIVARMSSAFTAASACLTVDF